MRSGECTGGCAWAEAYGCQRARGEQTRDREALQSDRVKKVHFTLGGVRNNTCNGMEQEFNSEKNSILLRAPPLFPKRRAAAGHFGITYESLHLRSLQSLTSAEGVNGDGEPGCMGLTRDD